MIGLEACKEKRELKCHESKENIQHSISNKAIFPSRTNLQFKNFIKPFFCLSFLNLSSLMSDEFVHQGFEQMCEAIDPLACCFGILVAHDWLRADDSNDLISTERVICGVKPKIWIAFLYSQLSEVHWKSAQIFFSKYLYSSVRHLKLVNILFCYKLKFFSVIKLKFSSKLKFDFKFAKVPDPIFCAFPVRSGQIQLNNCFSIQKVTRLSSSHISATLFFVLQLKCDPCPSDNSNKQTAFSSFGILERQCFFVCIFASTVGHDPKALLDEI